MRRLLVVLIAAFLAAGAPARAAAPKPAAPPKAASLLDQAEAARKSGDLAAAAVLLRRHLVEGPGLASDSDVRLLLARTLLELSREGPAANELLRLQAKDPAFFARSDAAALLAQATGALAPVEHEATAGEVAQVFVVPAVRGGPRQLYQALAAGGADVVAVRAFHLRGDRAHEGRQSLAAEGAYFATDTMPIVEDRLAFDVAAAHAAGLRCWGWMTTRRTPLSGPAAKDREVAFDARTGALVEKPALDLFSPRVVLALQQVYRDLARAGVDGILFQDDLMMAHLEGFSPHAAKAYRERTGKDLDPALLYRVIGEGETTRVEYLDAFWDFARLRRDRVLEVAAALQSAAREVNPSIECALNLYYETALDDRDALAWFSQDLEAAAAGPFRWLAVMAYARQVREELALTPQALEAKLERMATRLAGVKVAEGRVLAKIQARDWTTGEVVPDEELSRAAAPFRRFALCLAPADDPARVTSQLRALRGAPPPVAPPSAPAPAAKAP